MKHLMLLTILATSMVASSVLPPVDCPVSSQLGGRAFVTPGTTFYACLEDIDRTAGADDDFDDFILYGVVAQDGSVTFNFFGAEAAFVDTIYLGNRFLMSTHNRTNPTLSLTVGDEIILSAWTPQANLWFTGDGSRNSNGMPQWIIQQSGGSTVPEPSSVLLTLTGLFAISCKFYGRRDK